MYKPLYLLDINVYAFHGSCLYRKLYDFNNLVRGLCGAGEPSGQVSSVGYSGAFHRARRMLSRLISSADSTTDTSRCNVQKIMKFIVFLLDYIKICKEVQQ